MKLFENKKAFVGMWSDVFKGLAVGLILGIIIMLLFVYNVIPFPVDFCAGAAAP